MDGTPYAPLPCTPVLRVAVLGLASDGFPQAVNARLEELLNRGDRHHPPLPDIEFCRSPEQATKADLCWLLAWEPQPQQAAGETLSQLREYQALRSALLQLGMDHQVLRGGREQRLQHALSSLRPWFRELGPLLPSTGVNSRRPGGLACERCSDPECEHRSFTALLERRGAV